MDGPLVTRWKKSLADYERFESEYDQRLKRQIEILEGNPPDLVLADVPWLPMDAARRNEARGRTRTSQSR
jgi:hypothetical protein